MLFFHDRSSSFMLIALAGVGALGCLQASGRQGACASAMYRIASPRGTMDVPPDVVFNAYITVVRAVGLHPKLSEHSASS